MPFEKIDDFYAVTSHERERIDIINNLLKSNKERNALFNIIKQTDPALIVKQALVNSQLNAICNDTQLNAHWEGLWRQSGDYGNNTFYRPQQAISCFDLLKGIFIYWQYLKQKEAEPASQVTFDFLLLAANLGCFDAIRTICFTLFEKNNPDDIYKTVTLAKHAANLHLTPGYIILAKVYLLLYTKFSDQRFLTKTLQAIFMAEELLPISEAEFHNAYQQEDIRKILINENLLKLPNFLSNIHGTIEQTDSNLFAEARKMILLATPYDSNTRKMILDQAKENAKQESREIIKKFALDHFNDTSPFLSNKPLTIN